MLPEAALIKPFCAFEPADFAVARSAWGCPSGVAALAACFATTPEAIRPHILRLSPDDDPRPPGMEALVESLGGMPFDLTHRDEWPNNGLVLMGQDGTDDPFLTRRWIAFRRHRGWCYAFDPESFCRWVRWQEWSRSASRLGGWRALAKLEVYRRRITL